MKLLFSLLISSTLAFSANAEEAVTMPTAQAEKILKKAEPIAASDTQLKTFSVQAISYPTLVQSRPGIGFLKITNPFDETITLYGVDANSTSETVEIHTHKSKDGVMQMVQLDELKVPANSTLNFQDTHLHLMLMGMKKELAAGDSYPMTLKFQKEEGSLMPIEVEVSVVER